jgi:hypothetical protein
MRLTDSQQRALDAAWNEAEDRREELSAIKTKTPMGQVYWCGEATNCQLCPSKFSDGFMYDCIVPAYQQWANICSGCFHQYGCRFGLGLGQQYTKQADGRWLKTAG